MTPPDSNAPEPPELHPELTPGERGRLFREGIDRFNRREYFEAHETWETIWRSTTPEPRDLFQGLVQVAAALYGTLELGRGAGPRRTLAKARLRLEPFAPAASGLDLEALLRSVGEWEAWLAGGRQGEAPPPPILRVVDPAAVR